LGEISKQAKDAFEKVAFSANQLVKLVSNMLDLSRIESGKIEYHLAKNDFTKMLKTIVEEVKPRVEEKKLSIRLVKEGGQVPDFVFDHDRIRECVLNFVDNAIKYSREGEIVVRENYLDGGPNHRVRVSIKDHGIGINPDDLKRLFIKFARTDQSRQLDPSGMGIGLYYVKRVTEDHGGSVGVESEGLGKGSMFWIELPVKI
jgi:signal transduction histidine kinase